MRKIRLILKFITSQTGKQIITIHILPKFSRSKGNQTMFFGQVIEHEKHFLEKSYAKCSGEASPRPFSKKPKLSKSLDQQSKVLFTRFVFIVFESQ